MNLYIQDDVASSDNSQDEHNVVNNKSNIVEDIQNNVLKLQKLLDSDTQENSINKFNKLLKKLMWSIVDQTVQPKNQNV